MRKKFNKLMTVSLITSILSLLFGLFLTFYTKVSLDLIAYIIAGIVIFYGMFSIIDDYKQFKIFYFFDGFTSGLLSIILGIILLSNPEYLSVLIPLIIGLWFIINATFKLRMSLALKDASNNSWIIPYLLSLLTIIIGLCLIFNPIDASISIVKTIGFLTALYSVCDIIDVVIFKKNINAIAKVFE